MIDYNELDKFYTGIENRVIQNCGGVFLQLDEPVKSLFYKLDDDHYADVNRKGIIAQVLRKGTAVKSPYVIEEDTLVQVSSKQELNKNANPVKRLTFKKSNYAHKYIK